MYLTGSFLIATVPGTVKLILSMRPVYKVHYKKTIKPSSNPASASSNGPPTLLWCCVNIATRKINTNHRPDLQSVRFSLDNHGDSANSRASDKSLNNILSRPFQIHRFFCVCALPPSLSGESVRKLTPGGVWHTEHSMISYGVSWRGVCNLVCCKVKRRVCAFVWAHGTSNTGEDTRFGLER